MVESRGKTPDFKVRREEPSLQLDDKSADELEIWLDRKLNILVGRWLEFTSPDSNGNFDSRYVRQ